MSDVTRILSQIESVDPLAAEQLLPLVYNELRRMAAAQMAQEKPGQTLQATGLVHEAYVKLIGCDLPTSFANRRHFFGAAAEAMRRILIDEAASMIGISPSTGHHGSSEYRSRARRRCDRIRPALLRHGARARNSHH